ncbi:MAG: helix-turn-helix domain-containing protein [Anaerolineales bacterium]|nr:helix-turn-helix domain-containing protein [Anaerolineales bacterium]
MAEKFHAIYSVPAQRGFPIDEAARYLGMHPQTLRKLSDAGEIPCRRVGKHRVFLLEDLNSWLERQPMWVNDGHH